MSRWIDADALIMALRLEYPMMPMFKENQKEWGIKTEGYRKAEEVIKNAPSIDIVRCKECRHCSLDVCVERTVSGKERCINICNRHLTEWAVDKDWFCADGERIE